MDVRFDEREVRIRDRKLRLAYAREFSGAADDCYWASLWPSSVALARHVAGREDVEGLEVLELGCGCGLAGIAAGMRGARVTVTDVREEALELAEANWERNGVEPAAVEALDWCAPDVARDYDLILGADVLYDAKTFPDLVRSLTALLREEGALWIAEPGRPQAHEFFGRMLRAGFRVDPDHHEVELHGERFEICVSELR